MNILIIDVGTSSMRGILYRDTFDKLLSRQITYCPECQKAGWLHQKAAEFVDALEAIVKTINQKARQLKESIDVIAITAQRSSLIPLNEYGKPLMDVIMWQDTRNASICKKLEIHNNKIRKLSGACVNTVFSGGKMAWLRQNKPDIFRKVYKLVNIPEYLIHIMTGNYVTDFTYGSRSHLMNLKENRWDLELLSLFGIKEDYLCELLPPGSICGTITEHFALKTGLKERIPVLTAGGDQQCAAVGQGVFKEGKMSIITGTGAFISTVSNQIPLDLPSGFICNSFPIQGTYMIEANVLACCSAFNWFCKTFYEGKENYYAIINQELEAIADKQESCLVLPYFQGRGAPKWNTGAAASIHNITFAQTRADLLKAMLESIFLEIKNNMNLLINDVEISGISISGGLTKSPVINQMQADIYGLPINHMEDGESTALGALMVSLYSLGIYSSYDEMFRHVCRMSKMEVIKPKNKEEYYRKKQLEMNLLYEKIYQ